MGGFARQPGDHESSTEGPDLPSTDGVPDQGDDHARSTEDDAMIGCKIGRYTIKLLLGSGGMGTVFQAVQEQPRRRVAIKMMKQGITSRSAQRRFEFESQLLGRLKHPCIAQVYEAGTYDDGKGGRPYFVMEYIANAKTITEYADDKKLGTRERLELFTQVCDAVQHGHLKGIVHRDLKPGNILVGSQGRPRIIDFGVARSTDSDMAVTTLQTDVGQLVGTLQYMSPEQVEADPSDIDARSDVYALGIILYELLTGQLPYDVSKAAIHEAVRIVREEAPTKLSTIDRHLKGDVETITMKAMEKLRTHRYQSATELQKDIQNYLADKPIAASPPNAFDNMRRFARRHRAASIAIASIFVILLGAVVGVSLFALEANRQRAAAVQSQAQAESVSGFVSTMLSSQNPVTMGTIDKTLMKPVLSQATESLNKQFNNEPLVKAQLHRVIGRAYLNLGLYQDSEPHLAEALDIRISELGRDHLDTAQSLMDMGIQQNRERRSEDAAAFYKEAMETRLAQLGEDHPDTIEAMLYYGACLSILSEFERAHELMSKVIEHRKRTLGENDPKTLDAHMIYGSLLINESRYEESEVTFRETADRMRIALGTEDARTLRTLNNLAKVLSILGKDNEARPLYEETIEGRRKVLGEDHPFTLRTVNDLADLFLREQNFVRAEALYREILDSRRRVLGNEHIDTVWSLYFLGDMLRRDQRYEEAEPYLREALEGRRKILGPTHFRTAESLGSVARIMKHLKKYGEAERYYREQMKIRRDMDGEDDPFVIHLSIEIGDLLRMQKRYADAKTTLEQALQVSVKVLGEDAIADQARARQIIAMLNEDMRLITMNQGAVSKEPAVP